MTYRHVHAASRPTLAKNARMGHPLWEMAHTNIIKGGPPAPVRPFPTSRRQPLTAIAFDNNEPTSKPTKLDAYSSIPRGGFMSLKGHPRIAGQVTIAVQTLLASLALFAFLVMRNAPPDFPSPPSLHHSSITTVSDRTQRPQFNSEGLQWSAPVTRFLPYPPATESAHTNPAPQLLSSLQTSGFHYNRPPPAS
jgi:hypothetical protein